MGPVAKMLSVIKIDLAKLHRRYECTHIKIHTFGDTRCFMFETWKEEQKKKKIKWMNRICSEEFRKTTDAKRGCSLTILLVNIEFEKW